MTNRLRKRQSNPEGILTSTFTSNFWNIFGTTIFWLFLSVLLFAWTLWAGVNAASIVALLGICGMLLIILITNKYLIPKILVDQGLKLLYMLLSILLILLLTYICVKTEVWLIRWLEVPLKHELKLVYPVAKFLILFILTFSACNIFYFSHKIAADALEQAKLTMEKKDLEMKMLKTQINSHFLFNALNNIYSMIYFKDQETSNYVLKLSQMMRYVIEDCESDVTTILKEIEYIDNFIEFQQLRFETEKNIIFTRDISDYAQMIPPMILQPIVENCFKHCSLDLDDESYIKMHLRVDNRHLYFTTENSLPLINLEADVAERSSRIGLNNLQKRLNLIYKNNYKLTAQNDTRSYHVELVINLQ